VKPRVLALILGLVAILLLTSATLAEALTLKGQLSHLAHYARQFTPLVNSRGSVDASRTGHLGRGPLAAHERRSGRTAGLEAADVQVSGTLQDVSLNKGVHAMVAVPGQWINYFIYYENHTDATAQIVITDTMPDGVAYEEAYWGGGQPGAGDPVTETAIIGNQVVWELGELEGGAARWFHIEAHIGGTLSPDDVVENCATIGIVGADDSRPQDNTSCYSIVLRAEGANLVVHKEHDWSANQDKLQYRLHLMNAGTETISNVWITDILPLLTTWSGSSEANLDFPAGRLVFSGTVASGKLGWQFDYLDPGDAGWLYFDANLDEPWVPLRWFTNTVEIDEPPDDKNPADNTYQDLAFSGGEVREAHLWVETEQSNIWGLAQPGALITVTTPHTQTYAWADPVCGGCWEAGDSGPVLPGDSVVVEAGAAMQPVVIVVPNPFTAHADSGSDEVWGQIDHLDGEGIEVELYDGPIKSVQTDGDGNYSASFLDFPRGGTGEVRYDTSIDYTKVVFHRAFRAPDLVLNVNYGHDWVSARYEPGHTAWITVTESDGSTVKAMAEVTTGPIPWWEGQPGFKTQGDDWLFEQQPDIVPGDWVSGSVDNGHSGSVRVGTITGDLDVGADTASGTISASWFSQPLLALCAVWEEFGPQVEFVTGPGGGSYSCNLGALGWDLLPGNHVAVQYREPDGDWVINVFHVPAPHLGIEKGADGQPGEGGNLVFHISFWNGGDAAAENVVLTDTLEGMSYLADTSGILPATGTTPGGDEYVVWDMGTLEPEAANEFDVFVEVTAGVSETVINSVEIATSNPYDQGEPLEKHAEWGAHVEANDTHLNVDKWASPELPPPGSDFLYLVKVCNDGSTGSSEVVLTDTLALTTTLDLWWADEPGWVEESTSDHQLVVVRPSLAGGQCSQVRLRVRVDDGASPGDPLCNTALIGADNDLEWGDNVAEYWHEVGDYVTFVPLVLRNWP
jgi:uncharacterized repeat protein (TIGR01451 family)